ncbi:MAG: MaoC family dehydratase [Solirubrobacteraceae bacterium]|jgi:acyl dehydratase
MSSAPTVAVELDIDELRRSEGRHLGYGDWAEMTQTQVDAFADCTGDHNFLHVDPQRAKLTPFGGTIAHGFLSLALLAPVTQRLAVTDAKMSVNYGLDKVRFPAPLPVGAQWRGGAEIVEVTDINGGIQVKLAATIEVQGSERPAVAAECLVRYYA